MSGPELTIDGLDAAPRPFFELALPGAPARIVAERVLPLEGAHIFRDLGGFATTFRDRYSVLLDRLARPDTLPALISCTGGKDRAGFGAAVVLLALGVPRETVMADYLLTNHYTHARIERMLLVIRFPRCSAPIRSRSVHCWESTVATCRPPSTSSTATSARTRPSCATASGSPRASAAHCAERCCVEFTAPAVDSILIEN